MPPPGWVRPLPCVSGTVSGFGFRVQGFGSRVPSLEIGVGLLGRVCPPGACFRNWFGDWGQGLGSGV